MRFMIVQNHSCFNWMIPICIQVKCYVIMVTNRPESVPVSISSSQTPIVNIILSLLGIFSTKADHNFLLELIVTIFSINPLSLILLWVTVFSWGHRDIWNTEQIPDQLNPPILEKSVFNHCQIHNNNLSLFQHLQRLKTTMKVHLHWNNIT